MGKKSNDTLKIIISYILLLLWAAVIFLFSSKTAEASASQSNLILRLISKITGITLQENIFWSITELIVRKLAHLSIYILLGLLAHNAFRLTPFIDNAFITALVFCFLYSVSDEIHQLFVAGRACRFYDIIIDTSGAYLGAAVYPLLRKKVLVLFKRS